MPLLAHDRLPAYARLTREGVPVVAPAAWTGPVLHVGLVNTMADGAVEATERQFLRLLAAGAPDSGIVLHLCGLPEVPRGDHARRHIATHYLDWSALRVRRLDALIVTGANIADPDLGRLFYRASLEEVMAWADAEVPTTLYSCLGTHAALHYRYGKPRRVLPVKRWGVFPHRVVHPEHPLARGLAGGLMIPHSRWNEVPPEDFAAAGLQVLVVDAEDGAVHLAATPDRRSVFMQGHPEYEPVSLLKEHKRDVGLFAAGDMPGCPNAPPGLLEAEGRAILAAYRERVVDARRAGGAPPEYPEAEVLPHLRDSWRQDTERFFASWLTPAAGGAGS